MTTPLDNEVTRPGSFDPRKNYGAIIARGDNWLGDYDLNDLQAIFRQDMALLARQVLVEGAIIQEAGGSIGTPIAGINLGSDSLSVVGMYIGLESQVYTIRVATGGIAGTATFTWASTGSDGQQFAGTEHTVTAIAPTLAAAQAAPATYGHAVGVMGLVVYFINPNGFLTSANSWVVPVTYGARSPTVSINTITCYDSIVVVVGRPHRVAQATLTYGPASSGRDLVYGEWTRRIVEHSEDTTLRDPLSDTPQAWREEWLLAYRASDPSSLPLGAGVVERRVFPLYAWDRATDVVTPVVARPYAIDLQKTQGFLQASRLLNIDQNETFKGVLANLFGAHGSYVVSPKPPHPRATKSVNPPSSGKIRLALPPTTVMVEGVEVVHDSPSEVEIDQASETGSVADESHTYTAAANPFLLNKRVGSRIFPIKQITKVTATVQIGTPDSGGYEPVTRDTGADDALANSNVTAIVRISNTQGGAANYTNGVDYSLAGGNLVHWLTAPPPTGGNTYYVVYRYTKTMTGGVDYALTVPGEVEFGIGGDDPVEGTEFQVDYDYYLPRYDAIIVRPNGAFQVVKGAASEMPRLPMLPSLTLPYVQIEVPANSVAIRVHAYRNQVITMERINMALAQLEELMRDFMAQDLRNQARMRTSANFYDAFVEDFSTSDQADPTFDVGGVAFDCTIDTEAAEGVLPFLQSVATPERYTGAIPGTDTPVRVGGAFWTLPYTDEVAIESSVWSQAYPVNPYADFTPEPTAIALTPAQDEWVDTSALTETETVQILKTQARKLGILSSRQLATFREAFRRTYGRGPRRGEVFGELPPESISERVSEIASVYMRQITIQVAGWRFVPEEKLRCKFAGLDVAFTAVLPTLQGADAYTVLANAADVDVGLDVIRQRGDFVATFAIPANVPTGTVAVGIWGDSGMVGSVWPNDYTLRRSALFTSVGIVRQTISQERVVQVVLEPVAQSLIFPEARMISRVDIPFAAKAANGDAPVVFSIHATDRSGEASTPIPTVLSSVVREAIDVDAGVSSLNTFVPDDPVLCPADQFRALMLRSASNLYQIYVAILGAPNRGAGGLVESQAITGGIFMDSSNLRDWTPRQGWDLRCKVFVAKMSAQTARLYLTRINGTNLTAFTINADQVMPDGTSIDWEYSVDGTSPDNSGKVWLPCVPFLPTELTAAASTIDLRATLLSDSAYLTPGIHMHNLSVLLQSHGTTFTYVGRRKALTADAVRAKGGIETFIPAGGSLAVYVSVDDGVTWETASFGTGTALVDSFINRQFEVASFASVEKTNMRVRVEAVTLDRAKQVRIRDLYVFAEDA